MDCEERGGRTAENMDRYFLVVDAKHNHMFLTARTYPRMVLIDCSVKGGVLTVRFPATGEGEEEAVVKIEIKQAVERGDVRTGR